MKYGLIDMKCLSETSVYVSFICIYPFAIQLSLVVTVFSGSKSGEVISITCSLVWERNIFPWLVMLHSSLLKSRLRGFCSFLSAQMWFRVLCIFCATQALEHTVAWGASHMWRKPVGILQPPQASKIVLWHTMASKIKFKLGMNKISQW